MNIDIETADIYFSTRADSLIWEELTAEDKQKALTTAYNFIKTFPFIGEKVSLNQEDIFPRIFKGVTIQLPKDVMFGVFEEALSIVKRAANSTQDIPDGVQAISLGNSSVTFKSEYSHKNLSKNSQNFLEGWLKKGFDIEGEKFREVY